MFATSIHFHPSLIFADKAGAYQSGASLKPHSRYYSNGRLLTLFTNSRPGANVIKLFLSVMYGFSYKARVFLRLDQESLPMTNTLAFYENPQFTDKNIYNIGPRGHCCKTFLFVIHGFLY